MVYRVLWQNIDWHLLQHCLQGSIQKRKEAGSDHRAVLEHSSHPELSLHEEEGLDDRWVLRLPTTADQCHSVLEVPFFHGAVSLEADDWSYRKLTVPLVHQ